MTLYKLLCTMETAVGYNIITSKTKGIDFVILVSLYNLGYT